MRFASSRTVVSLLCSFGLGSLLTGCPEKGEAPAEKTAAEPERAEPDDEGRAADDKARKPAALPATAPIEDKKPDDAKDDGGW